MAASISRPGTADGITDFQANFKLELTPSGKDAACPYQLVQAYLGAHRLQVYIAKEVSPRDCRFRAVYEHEMQHVVIAQNAVDRGAAWLKRTLRAALAGFTAEQLAEPLLVKEELDKLVAQAVDVVYEDYAQANEKLDTPEEGARLAALCESPKLSVGGVEQR